MNTTLLNSLAIGMGLWLTGCATSPNSPVLVSTTEVNCPNLYVASKFLTDKPCDIQNTFKIDANGKPFDYTLIKSCDDLFNHQIIEQYVQQSTVSSCHFPKVEKHIQRYSNFSLHLTPHAPPTPKLVKLKSRVNDLDITLSCPEPIMPSELQDAEQVCVASVEVVFDSTKVKNVNSHASCAEPMRTLVNQSVVEAYSKCSVNSPVKFKEVKKVFHIVFEPW